MEKKQILKDTAAGDPLFFTKLNVNHKNPAIKVYELLAAQFEKIPNLKTKNYLKTAYLFNAFTYGYIEYWLIYNENLSASIDEAYKLFMKGVVE